MSLEEANGTVTTLEEGTSCAPEHPHLMDAGLVWYCRGPTENDHAAGDSLARFEADLDRWAIPRSSFGMVADRRTLYVTHFVPGPVHFLFAVEPRSKSETPLAEVPTFAVGGLRGVTEKAVIGVFGREIVAIDKRSGARHVLWSAPDHAIAECVTSDAEVLFLWETVAADGYSPKQVLLAASMSGETRNLVAVEFPESLCSIATDGQFAYYVRGPRRAGEKSGRIEQLGLNGEEPRTLVADPGPAPRTLTTGGGRLLWIAGDELRAIRVR